MKKYEQIYNFELDKLKKFCDEIKINVDIIDGQIEYIALLTGNGQVDILEKATIRES